MKKITFMLFALLSMTIGFAQTETLAEWTPATNPGGSGDYGPSPFTASITADNLVVGGLTRGSGIGTTSGSGAANGWGGNDFTSTDAATAISENEFVTFTITADAGHTLSIESIEPYNIRRSGTGPTTGQWQYQVGSGSFVDIETPITWGSGTGNAGNEQDAIDLSGISDLQNIDEDTTVTFRLLLWGASGTGGTWYLNGHNNATSKTLTVLGTVEEESGSTPPPACDIEVTLTFPEYGDVTEWRLLDANGTAVLTGGPYWDDDFSVSFTHTTVNPPYSLEITIDDWMEYCDNDVYYSVTVGGVQDIQGVVYTACEDIITQTFVIGDCPDCPLPSGLGVSTTSDSATLSWTGAGDTFDVLWGVKGFNPNSEGTLDDDVTSPYLLENLSIGTYEFYVRQTCGTDLTDWAGPYTFVIGGYSGNIPSQFNSTPTVNSTNFCTPEPMITIEVPVGYQISGLQVQYSMKATTELENGTFSDAFMSEQRSFIYSPSLEVGETTLAQGLGNGPGTYFYNRSLNFANGETGTVTFVLRTWRTWQGIAGCNTDINYVVDGTWVIIPTFDPDPCYGVVIPTTIAASAIEVCEGTSVELEVVPGTGNTYSWSDGTTEVGTTASITVTPTATTTYSVTVTNSDGCTATSEDVVITVNEAPEEPTDLECYEIATFNDATCEWDITGTAPAEPEVVSPQNLTDGQTVADIVVTNVTGTLNWYDDNGNPISDSEVLTEGVHTFYVSQTIDGCESDEVEVVVEVTLSTGVFDNASFRAYPNPVKGFFNVSYSKDITNVTVINMLGQTVISQTVNTADAQIDMTSLPIGTYFVKVTADGAVKTVKVIKN